MVIKGDGKIKAISRGWWAVCATVLDLGEAADSTTARE